MLGYIVAEGRGEADRVIREAALALGAGGLSVAGAVQVNRDPDDPARKCDMDLHILSGAEVVRISQDLGALSRGCRLDPEGLERAVGLVEAGLAAGAELLVVNKFGKQEAGGRGFRPVIGRALAAGVPVLTAVNAGTVPAFEDWAGGLAERLPEDLDRILSWCAVVTGRESDAFWGDIGGRESRTRAS